MRTTPRSTTTGGGSATSSLNPIRLARWVTSSSVTPAFAKSWRKCQPALQKAVEQTRVADRAELKRRLDRVVKAGGEG